MKADEYWPIMFNQMTQMNSEVSHSLSNKLVSKKPGFS